MEDSGGFRRRNSVEDPEPFILFEVVDLTGRPAMASDRPTPSHTHCHDCRAGQIKRQGTSNPAVNPMAMGDEVEKARCPAPALREALLHQVVPCILAVGQIAPSQMEVIIDLLYWKFSKDKFNFAGLY